MAIDTIPNRHPQIRTVITLTTPFVAACPHSGEPQIGTTISVTYTAGNELIELHSVEKFLKELSDGNDALDMETVCQLLFLSCKDAGMIVRVRGEYKLRNGLQLICEV